jgi:hypothetical protein
MPFVLGDTSPVITRFGQRDSRANFCGASQRVIPSVFGEPDGNLNSSPGRQKTCYIVFVDEAGFMLAPLRRRTWAPRGCTPILKISEPHGRISVIAAITISPQYRHFSFYFQLSAGGYFNSHLGEYLRMAQICSSVMTSPSILPEANRGKPLRRCL